MAVVDFTGRAVQTFFAARRNRIGVRQLPSCSPTVLVAMPFIGTL
jgi:hypothetical protein